MGSTTTRLLPGDNPQAYLPGDRRRALARGRSLPEQTTGSALFVDISGFTPLTEALAAELGGRRGAEELTAALDRVFSALLERLHAWRGSVIYFSGDAVTAWLDGDDGLAAVACALEMQTVMDEVGLVTTPRGSQVRLGVKIAVATGPVHRFVVGDPDVQLIDVLAGGLTDSLAEAEQVAEPGDVVVDAATLASLGGRLEVAEVRSGRHGPVGVARRLTVATSDPGAPEEPPVLAEELVRPWVLPPVWARMAAGRGELLAELRPAVPVFLRFGGLDFDADPAAGERLDAFVRRTQRVFARHGGYVLQLTIGDKGAYLYAVFGAPVAHEDDAARACAAALDLLSDDEPLTVTDVSAGIATGRLRSGTYGHRQRRTFCCLGDAVNLSARLMSRAPAGEVWVHGEVADATGHRFAWDDLEPITVKGKSRPVRVRVLRGRAALTRVPAQRSGREPIVGRAQELELLRGLVAATVVGEGQTVVVRAEAGTGKSRLVAELLDELRDQGLAVVTGEATPVAGVSGYTAWRSVWLDLLGIDPDGAGLRDVSTAVADLDVRLVARAPLLGPVLGLALPDSELTASFDGELRKTSLEDLLARLVRLRSARGPLVVVIEDGHWLDPLSRDLLGVLARVTSSAALLLVVTSRPDGSAHAGLPVASARRVTDLALEALDPEAARRLARARHRAVTDEEASEETVDLVVTRSEGNPFYLEQLVDHLAAAADAGADGGEHHRELPPSLHSLVLSRIDAQEEGPRRAVKVASIVGRSFHAGLLADAYPELGDDDEVEGHLLQVARTRLVDLEHPQERRFAFGHAVTRDVAYDSLPYGIRTVLHGRIGDALEQEPDGPRRHLDLLVHHYTRSEDIPQQRRYLLAAAEAARATYAVAAAVGHLEQVLPLLDPDERPGVLLKLAEAHEAGGDWGEAEDAVARAAEAAEDVGDDLEGARAAVARAELDRKQGRYGDASAALAMAERAFDALGDLAGRARVLHLRGTLASQQGDPAAARAAYEASREIRAAHGDDEGVAAMLTNLALCAEDEGDLEGAERIGADALERRRRLPDRRAVSVSLMNMGMLATLRNRLAEAEDRFAEAMELAEVVGDVWLAAVGRHNLGNVTRDRGDLAASARHLTVALDVYAERQDRWSLAHVFEDAALAALRSGRGLEVEAVRVLAAAAAVRAEIGAPRFAPTQETLDVALAALDGRTSLDQRSAWEHEGGEWTLEEAVDRTRRILSQLA